MFPEHISNLIVVADAACEEWLAAGKAWEREPGNTRLLAAVERTSKDYSTATRRLHHAISKAHHEHVS